MSAASEDLRLAVSYRDYWLLGMSGTFVGGYVIGLAVLAAMGSLAGMLRLGVEGLPYLPVAFFLGATLAWVDAKRTSHHSTAYADVERARQQVRWLTGIWRFERARSRHRCILLGDSGVFFLPAVFWVGAFGFIGSLLPLAMMAATEHLVWRLYWRPKLKNQVSVQ